MNKITNYLNEKFLIITALGLLAFFVGYIIYVNFSYYWDFLHSDIVSDLSFIREAASNFSLFPDGWSHLNEMRFIYVTTPAILFYWITGNVHLAYSLAVSFMLIINVALFYYMLSYKKRSIFAIIIGAIVFLMFFSKYDIFSVFSILFINGTLSTHLATVFLTIGVYMRIKHKADEGFKFQKALWVITLLLAFAQGIQSTRMAVVLYAPLLLVEVLAIFRSVKGENYKIKWAGITYAVIAFSLNGLGLILRNLLIANGTVVLEASGLTLGSNLASTGLFAERIIEMLTTVFYTFGLVGGVNLFSAAGLAFVIRVCFIITIIYIYRNLKKDSVDQNLVQLLTSIVIFSALSQAIISMGMGQRFNFVAPSFMAVIFVISLGNMIESLRNSIKDKEDATKELISYHRLQKSLIGSLVIIVIMGSFLSINTLGTTRNPGLVEDRQRIADFLKEENLTIGYGSFWQGHVITGVANWEVVVIPFRANMGVTGRPLRQGVSYSDFYHDEDRVFLIASTTQITSAYDHYRVRPILEEGERHDFPGAWVVYIFEENPWAEMK